MYNADFLNCPGFVLRFGVNWKTLGCGRAERVPGSCLSKYTGQGPQAWNLFPSH